MKWNKANRVLIIALLICNACSVHSINPEVITDEEYMKAYFTMYGDYIGGGEGFTKEELMDIVKYYLTNKHVSDNLNYVGTNSGKMIGSILADAGVVFDCGACDESIKGIRCCIYRIGQVPMAYECVGTEVLGITDYSWKQLWQCTYGCCRNNCCLESGSPTSVSSTSTASQTTTSVISSTTTTKNPTTSTTVTATSSTTPSTIPANPKITLLFVPLDWSGDYLSFDSEAERDVKFLTDQTNLKDCPAEVSVKKIHASCPVQIPPDMDSCLKDADLFLRGMDECARASGEAYDYVVGISGKDNCGVIDGLAAGIGAIYIENGSPDILAHEMGHELGLNDEYVDVCRCKEGLIDPNANCLDPDIGGSDPYGNYTKDYCAQGTKCASYPQVTCKGNKNPEGGRCLMGLSSEPAGFCAHCTAILNSKLKC